MNIRTVRLQEEGIVAANNHRTQYRDLDFLIAEILRLGDELRA